MLGLIIDSKCVHQSLKNPSVKDLEEGFQYYAASEAGCECIVIENQNDFYFSEMEILNSEDFLKKYIF